MVAMAEEFGSDPRLVAFMQYVRVVAVVLSASVVARFSPIHRRTGPPAVAAEAAASSDAVTLAVAAAGAGIALGWACPRAR